MKKKLKRILSITAILLLLAVNLSGFAFADGDHHKVIDGADLLTADEEKLLEERLAEIENEYLLDAVVLTVDDTNGLEIEDFADTYYEENGFGIGEDRDGAMLVIDMGGRSWHITTMGKCISVLSDDALYTIENAMMDNLSSGYFYDAFYYGYAGNIEYFAQYFDESGEPYSDPSISDQADDYYNNGEYYYYDDYEYEPVFDLGTTIKIYLPASLIPGFAFSFVMAKSEKNKLTSVRAKKEANSFIRRGSLKITNDRTRYMYSNVVVTVKQDNSGSGASHSGGSHVHMSSGGHVHGGRGGHF